MLGVCVFRNALQQQVHVRLAHTTVTPVTPVTPVNENGDEKGGRPARNVCDIVAAGGLESFSPLSRRSEAKTDRNPFSSPFSSTDSHVSHRANENTTCIDRAAVLRNQLTMNALLG